MQYSRQIVILDETGHIVAHVTTRSRINPVLSAQAALQEAADQVPELNKADDLAYLVGTGYGRNKVPFADSVCTRVYPQTEGSWSSSLSSVCTPCCSS